MSVIVTILSGVFFSFLLHNLNDNICKIFMPIQRDLGNLSIANRRILNFLGYVLSILISVLLRVIFNNSSVVWCVILGFLMALVDTCFGDNIIDNITKKNKEEY